MVWIRFVSSVWPFNWPSRCDGYILWILHESLLACHSIRFSRFRRSEAIRYRCLVPLSIAFRDQFRRTFFARLSEMQNAPAFLAGSVGIVPVYQHCWSGPAIRSPSSKLDLSRRARLRLIGTGSFDKLPSLQQRRKGVSRVSQGIPDKHQESPDDTHVTPLADLKNTPL